MMLRWKTSQKHGPVIGIIHPGLGVAKKNQTWCDGLPSGGSHVATEKSHPAATGHGNSESPTPGFND
jgi:hypothetical protein